MRHRKAGKKLGRSTAHRKALLRNLLTSLVEHEKLHLTHTRAKVLKRVADKLVTLGKKDSLHARRIAAATFYGRNPTTDDKSGRTSGEGGAASKKELVRKLFEVIAPRFKDRPGGYTRVIPLGFRRGDAAPMSIIEFLGEDEIYTPKKSLDQVSEESEDTGPAAEAAPQAETAPETEEV